LLPIVQTYAQLNTTYPPGSYSGYIATTSDLGTVYSDGTVWRKSAAGTNALNKLRACIAKAAISNAATAQPLIQPSAWLTATAYTTGTSVTNAGNNYICFNNGTSAVAPTATTNALIADGTLTWYYAGPAFTTSPNAPTFASVIATSKYTGNFWRTTTGTRTDGTTQISDSTNFLTTGGAITETGSQNSFVCSTASTAMSVSFMTDAITFQIVAQGTTTPRCAIYVNSVPLFVGNGSNSTNGQAVNYLQLTFSTRTPRMITVELPNSLPFFGVLMNEGTSKVWAPSSPNSVRVGIVGTSYLSGSSQHPVTPALGLGPLIAKGLGILDCFTDAAGAGTGYQQTNSGTRYDSRLPALTAYNPEIVIITGGGINDRNFPGVTLANEQAAVLSYLQQLRVALPAAIIFVIGSESGATGPLANVFNMELAALQAVAQFADLMTFFIPQSSTNAGKAWVSGTGTTAATNNSGSSDNYIGADGIHPVHGGVQYLAQNNVIGIASAVNGIAA
jgi:hypothetical protein